MPDKTGLLTTRNRRGQKKKPKLEQIVTLGFFAEFFEGESSSSTIPKKENEKEILDDRNTIRLGGLKSRLRKRNKKTQTSSENKPVDEIPKSSDKDLKTITTEDLTVVFKEYALELIEQSRRSLSAFFNDPIFSYNSGEITFTVGSNTVAKEVEQEQKAFNAYLKKHGFSRVKVICNVDAAKVQEYKIFTPKQEFEQLSKEYPQLKELAKRFNLSIDE